VPAPAFNPDFRDLCKVFRHKPVQDLYWTFQSPDLLNRKTFHDHPLFQLTDSASLLPWLKALDNNPQHLIQHLKQYSNTRLGKYFEALWQFTLTHHPQIKLKAANLQIQDNHRTLGELDFIIEEGDNCIHLELAVKFYLYVPELNKGETLQGWIGPNCNDYFEKKLKRLSSHQLTLPTNPTAQSLLTQKNLTIDSSELILKGVLFKPLITKIDATKVDNAIIDSPLLSEHHLEGIWLYQHQLADFLPVTEFWQPLDKMGWMTPCHNNKTHLPADQIEAYLDEYFSQNKRPLQFLVTHLRKTESIADEMDKLKQRVFVVPHDWPWLQAA